MVKNEIKDTCLSVTKNLVLFPENGQTRKDGQLANDLHKCLDPDHSPTL